MALLAQTHPGASEPKLQPEDHVQWREGVLEDQGGEVMDGCGDRSEAAMMVRREGGMRGVWSTTIGPTLLKKSVLP